MNKLRTIGISALAGSLAAFSAQAFEASVSGGAEITISHQGGSDVTGNPYQPALRQQFRQWAPLCGRVEIQVEATELILWLPHHV